MIHSVLRATPKNNSGSAILVLHHSTHGSMARLDIPLNKPVSPNGRFAVPITTDPGRHGAPILRWQL